MRLRPKDDQHVISQLDTVELLSGEGRAPFVAQVEALWEERGTGQWKVRTRWYYRPEDLPASVLAAYPLGRALPNEVFLSGERDDNDVQSILGRVAVARVDG
ncbi:hypothetical protein JKP88DRAFT_181662, partial [Tribonema minus]